MVSSRSRNKRDISSFFARPRKTEKRSDRVVKQYNKQLKERPSNKASFSESSKPLKSRSVAAVPSAPIRPLQQLTNLFTMPRFRNKRDIKGEYDLIEKEREQLDLTLPEIIQFLPEALDPNYKRNKCFIGQGCQICDPIESTTTLTTTTSSDSETTTASTESVNTTPESLSVTSTNKYEQLDDDVGLDGGRDTEMDNSISSTLTKRNAANYDGDACNHQHLDFTTSNPPPSSGYTFDPLTNFEAKPRPFATPNNPYSQDPIPQQYVGAPISPYAPPILDTAPLVGAAYPNPSLQPFSNVQLDRIIAEIVNRYREFIEATSHSGGALVDPVGVQKEQTKALLANLMGGFISRDQPPQYHQIHAHIPSSIPPPPPPPYYHSSAAAHVPNTPLYQ